MTFRAPQACPLERKSEFVQPLVVAFLFGGTGSALSGVSCQLRSIKWNEYHSWSLELRTMRRCS